MNTELLNKTYKVLLKKGPLSCSEIGWALWGHSSTAQKGTGVYKQNKFCRPAGRVLKILETQGRASHFQHGRKIIWKAMPSGESNGKNFISDNLFN
ncbi:MAG: hypothetical protein M0R32_03500 [Candidatus Cloacimonetes bacterium]|jgi:hypothetical protein|nr:hypothetical protein [Candidatus Cloacimonadota bacterium]